MKNESKKAQKVVNRGELHGLTSLKRSDGFIISLWWNGKEAAINDWSTLYSSKIAVSLLLVNEEQLEKRTDYWKFKICQKEHEKNQRNKVQTDAPLKYN